MKVRAKRPFRDPRIGWIKRGSEVDVTAKRATELETEGKVEKMTRAPENKAAAEPENKSE